MKKVTGKLITDFEKFKTAWEEAAGSPENTILYYIIAALNLERDPKIGEAMMTVVVSKKDLKEDGKSPSGYKLNPMGSGYYIGQFLKDKNIARSYVGGTPENEYQIDEKNLVMTVVKEQDKGNQGLKIFIQSGGKDNPTPVTLKKNRHGQWKMIEFSSICTGVKRPASEVDDF